jgi:hypothetical protein
MTTRSHRHRCAFGALAAATLVAACGGGDNPLGNPPTVVNTPGGSGQSLSFVYFQKCVNPVLVAQLSLPAGGTGSCASAGCHDNANGTGGAFRMQASATFIDLANAANTPDAVRLTEMYRNFYSAQGSTVIGAPTSSRLVNKPLVQGVLHGGGVIFSNTNDPNLKLLQYWISRPMPAGQDEFSNAAAAMFTPADPTTGSCNTQ